MATEVKGTIVGRCVWGDVGEPKPKMDLDTKQPVLKDGQPVMQTAFGLAFDKAQFAEHIWPYMASEAATAFPNGTPPQFSWKYIDGDTTDKQGKPYSAREGYGGCIVLTVKTEAFSPPVYAFENGSYRQMQPTEFKTGDYFAIDLKLRVNVPTNRTHTPGLYVNPEGLLFFQAGPAIMNSANPEDMFSGVRSQLSLPPGAPTMQLPASNMPQGQPMGQPQGQPMQQPMGQPQGQPMQQPMGQPQGQPIQQPMGQPQGQPMQQPMQPATGFAQGPGSTPTPNG